MLMPTAKQGMSLRIFKPPDTFVDPQHISSSSATVFTGSNRFTMSCSQIRFCYLILISYCHLSQLNYKFIKDAVALKNIQSSVEKLWLVCYSNWGLWQVLVKPTWCSTSPARKSFKTNTVRPDIYIVILFFKHNILLLFTTLCIEEKQNVEGCKNPKESERTLRIPREPIEAHLLQI